MNGIQAGRIPWVQLEEKCGERVGQGKGVGGGGKLKLPKILEKLQTLGKTKYMLVEQDDCYGESAFDCLKRSYDNVRKMGY